MLGCTLSPHRSLHVVTLPMIINTVCSFSWIFQWQTSLLQIPGSDFLFDSRSVTWLRCFIYFFCSLNNSTISKVCGVGEENDRTEIRRYAERNEMKMHPRPIQYLCVIWDYSGSEDSHGWQIKKTQGWRTNRVWDERRKWWKNQGDRDLWTWSERCRRTATWKDRGTSKRATIISRKHKRSNARTWETS